MPKIQASGYSYDFSDSSISGSIPIEVLDIAVSSATASIDFASGSMFSVDHDSNDTVMIDYSNEYVGMSAMIFVKHDGTSSGSIEFGSQQIQFPGGTVPTFTTSANSKDLITLTCFESSVVLANASLDFS